MGVGKDLAKTSQVVGGGTKSQPSANKVTSLLITVLLASLECLWSTRHAPWEGWERVYPGSGHYLDSPLDYLCDPR